MRGKLIALGVVLCAALAGGALWVLDRPAPATSRLTSDVS